ncbi:hypothetical protein HK101_010105 [Irineochytrium annulatum]|nr:hypothetical protein HK101_010105 [Irineochytrium annulatum]
MPWTFDDLDGLQIPVSLKLPSSGSGNSGPKSSNPSGGPMFSAERHYAHLAKLAEAELQPPQQPLGAERLRVESMIAEGSDEVLMEARSLLRRWVEDNDGCGVVDGDECIEGIAGGIEDDVSARVGVGLFDLEGKGRMADGDGRKRVRGIVVDAVRRSVVGDAVSAASDVAMNGGGRMFEVVRDPKAVMDARQRAARERRDCVERQRREELERKVAERAAKMAEERRAKEVDMQRMRGEVENRWRADKAMKDARREIGEMVGERKARIVDECLKMAEGVRMELIDEACAIKSADLRRKEDEVKERKRAIVIAKVNELYTIKSLKRIRAYFTAWQTLVHSERQKLTSFRVVSNWRALNRGWIRWVIKRKQHEGRRHAEQVAHAIKKDNEHLLRAARYHRATTLSKCVVAWSAWAKLQRDTRLIRRQHEDRAKKMREFLETIERVAERKENELAARVDAIGKEVGEVVEGESKGNGKKATFKDVLEGVVPEEVDVAAVSAAPAAEGPTSIAPAVFVPVSRGTDSETGIQPKKVTIKEPSKPSRKPIRSSRDQELIHQMEKRNAERLERKTALEQKRKEKQEAIEAEKIEQERLKAEAEVAERRRYLEQKMEEQRLAKERWKEERAATSVADAIARLGALKSALVEWREETKLAIRDRLAKERVLEKKADGFASK